MRDGAVHRHRLRAAVIGLGTMGRHHVRVLSELPEVELVAVCDVKAASVRRITDERRVRGYADPAVLLDRERLDMVSVVVPTTLHYFVTRMVIERGIACLVEKPIAATIDEARSLLASARQGGVQLMVGHIERFNPAILELKRRIVQVGAVFQIAARRVGPFPERIQDVGVVVDLASHDIDVMNFILDEPIISVYAHTAQRLHATHEDMIVGMMQFVGGAVGTLDVNWLTSTKIRELTVTGRQGTFVANYLTQDLAFYENAANAREWENLAELQAISEGHAVRYAFRREEPLRAELAAFAACVRSSAPPPSPPEASALALEIALDLLASAQCGQPIRPESSLFGPNVAARSASEHRS